MQRNCWLWCHFCLSYVLVDYGSVVQDLGEFGIAARQMKTSIEAGESGTEKHLLAWERSTQSSLESSLSARLEKLIRPTRYRRIAF